MKPDQLPRNNLQALIQAVHYVRPPVLRNIEIDTDPDKLSVVRMEFVLTPELVKAWGEQCAEMIERAGT